MRVLSVVFCGFAMMACLKGAENSQPPPPATAPAIPWQPHGVATPTVRCEYDVPSGLTVSPAPMKDHIAELLSAETPPKTTVIVGQRAERTLGAARDRVLAFYRGGLLKSPGARTTADAALTVAHAPGHLLSLRWGTADAGQVETVALLAFDREPIVEVVARHTERDEPARAAVDALVRSLRCSRPAKAPAPLPR